MISILLNLKLVLWPNIPILENISYALEKNVYSAVVGWTILQLSVRSTWFIEFKSPTYLLMFCLVVLVIIESGELKSPNTIAELCISSVLSLFCSMYLEFSC